MSPPTLRPYRDSDAGALAHLYNEGLVHPSRIRLNADSVRRRWLDHHGFRASEGSWIAEGTDQTVEAAAHLLFDEASDTAPLPEVRLRFWLLASAERARSDPELVRRLVSLAMGAAGRAPRRGGFRHFVGSNAMVGDAWREDVLSEAGLRPARSFLTMRHDRLETLATPGSVAGLHIQGWRPELDLGTWQAFNEAFRDHWGYQEIPYEEFRRMAHGPDSQPHLWQIAVDETSAEVAGINLTGITPSPDSPPREGWIHDLAVRRPWRGRGLGHALLLAGMRVLRDATGIDSILLTVDRENPTGALGLYRKAGFEVVYEQRAWEALLNP